MRYERKANAERNLCIGLVGAVLTLIGDLLIGFVKFPDGANMMEGYLAAALAMPVWRPIAGGLIGFLGISLEFLGLGAVCRTMCISPSPAEPFTCRAAC